MRIAINALSVKIGGGVTYMRNLVPRIAKADPDDEYFLIVAAENYQAVFSSLVLGPNLTIIKISTRNRLLVRMFKEQFVLPFVMRRHRIDILFCPANIISFFARCRQVLWIQNIDPFVYIEGETWLRRMKVAFLRMFTKMSILLADIVIFSSAYSQQLVLNQMRLQKNKTRRISLGAELGPFNRLKDREKQNDRSYILSVSNISKRKNYEVLIRAYAHLPSELRNKYCLVLVGRVDDKYQAELLGLCVDKKARAGIEFTGELRGDDLYRTYKNATLFVLPSLVESFGLPVFEAMASGLPVIAANATCLPEMVGDSGFIFDPYDYRDLAEKIQRLIVDPELQKTLTEKGNNKANWFSWDRTASETVKVFKELGPKIGYNL